MSSDKLVYDLSQEVEGSPNVFVRKDWINILDNQNQSYQANQSIIDTSQLSNSNKYMAYREAYLSVPLLLTIVGPVTAAGGVYTIGDYAYGLKNWFGTIIHSMTLDYNGTTIVQQTPFCNMWNSFKLLTSLSWNDVMTQGPTIGFYPDTAGAWVYNVAEGLEGIYVCNNVDTLYQQNTSSLSLNVYDQPINNANVVANGGNQGLTYRTKWIAYNPNAGEYIGYNSFCTGTSCNQIWKSYISKKLPASDVQSGILQLSVMATIYLKHIHSFFNMCPLLKGVFMKITLNLNNSLSTITATANGMSYGVSVPVGGVNPTLVPSISSGGAFMNSTVADTFPAGASIVYYETSVGAKILNPIISSYAVGTGPGLGLLSQSVYLYVPAYTFNPIFESAYLSNNIKTIRYTDIYQYQVSTAIAGGGGGQFNNLITNGIANIKSVLIIPFLAPFVGEPAPPGPTYQSPFDTAGTGTTAPMVTLGNFNVQISGQNAIYNTQRYTFEEWNNQLYGENAVNGGLTDGLTSGLINFSDFQNSYCYYYVNVERMLPVEQSVPKSVQIIGTNYSQQPLYLWVFIEYGTQIKIDVLTGARV